MRTVFLFRLGIVLLLCGCATTEQPSAVVEDDEVMTHLGQSLKPENLLFPEYLLMVDFELDQHGWIPNTGVVGGDLKTELDLETTRQRFNGLLVSKGWTITTEETAKHSYRLLAATKGDALEIRAVQGIGPTQVFILYQPKPEIPAVN